MDGSVSDENSSFKMLELSFSSKLDWGSYIVSIYKTEMVCISVGPSCDVFLKPLSHQRNVASLGPFYRYYVGRSGVVLG